MLPEPFPGLGVVSLEESVSFFQVLDDGRHQPGSQAGGFRLQPVSQQSLADQRIPGQMDGLAGGIDCPLGRSGTGFG